VISIKNATSYRISTVRSEFILLCSVIVLQIGQFSLHLHWLFGRPVLTFFYPLLLYCNIQPQQLHSQQELLVSLAQLAETAASVSFSP
jgi:hypothetical protein